MLHSEAMSTPTSLMNTTSTSDATLATPKRDSWEGIMQRFGFSQKDSDRMHDLMTGRVQEPATFFVIHKFRYPEEETRLAILLARALVLEDEPYKTTEGEGQTAPRIASPSLQVREIMMAAGRLLAAVAEDRRRMEALIPDGVGIFVHEAGRSISLSFAGDVLNGRIVEPTGSFSQRTLGLSVEPRDVKARTLIWVVWAEGWSNTLLSNTSWVLDNVEGPMAP
ncbi:hypothetical protein K491DRAFT_784671 [Lophiostoma macrostomum CBS 122681]|uniref:Uncharacterized protein n=1 Tax=Lophiostoma macrostomum CBS 122681 TaxID=1314788 RepID=A0A6A6SIA8_9PLEO|nr:hypothetical protein K491DRAFT_784671 [Lophiostoma macrostomum CBS 122681]